MVDSSLMILGMINLFISAIFLSLAWTLWKRAQANGIVIWVDLGKTLLMAGICMVAQSLVIAALSTSPQENRLLWFIVFVLFAMTGVLIGRWCYRTQRMLATLMGGEV